MPTSEFALRYGVVALLAAGFGAAVTTALIGPPPRGYRHAIPRLLLWTAALWVAVVLFHATLSKLRAAPPTPRPDPPPGAPPCRP